MDILHLPVHASEIEAMFYKHVCITSLPHPISSSVIHKVDLQQPTTQIHMQGLGVLINMWYMSVISQGVPVHKENPCLLSGPFVFVSPRCSANAPERKNKNFVNSLRCIHFCLQPQNIGISWRHEKARADKSHDECGDESKIKGTNQRLAITQSIWWIIFDTSLCWADKLENLPTWACLSTPSHIASKKEVLGSTVKHMWKRESLMQADLEQGSPDKKSRVK